MKTYVSHSAGVHGWLSVKRKELYDLGIANNISRFPMRSVRQCTLKKIVMLLDSVRHTSRYMVNIQKCVPVTVSTRQFVD